MPNRHLYFRGSQHCVSVEGMGRIVGFAEKDALALNTRCVDLGVIDGVGLQRGASDGQSNSVGSQHSPSRFVGMEGKEGMGVIDSDGLQIGANEGQVLNRGSQQALGGIDGRPVPPPGGQRGTKSGQGNLSGSQHASLGIGGSEGIIVGVAETSQIG